MSRAAVPTPIHVVKLSSGFTFEEALGEGYAKSIYPDDREWVFAEWIAFASAGREHYAEYRFQTKEGIVRWVQARTAPMLSDQGELIGHVGTIEDITVAKCLETERKQAAEALHFRNQELLTLHKISEITLGAQSLKTAFQEIVEETSASTGFPIIAIELYDEARQIMVFAGVKGVPLPADESVLEVPVDQTLSGTVGTELRTGGKAMRSNTVSSGRQMGYTAGTLLGFHQSKVQTAKSLSGSGQPQKSTLASKLKRHCNAVKVVSHSFTAAFQIGYF